MKDVQLQKMSIKELRSLKDRVDHAISTVAQREKADLQAKFAVLAAEHGMSLAELMGGKASSGRKYGPATIKYRNPKNPSETWAGRGRRPLWMVRLGGSPEKYKVA